MAAKRSPLASLHEKGALFGGFCGLLLLTWACSGNGNTTGSGEPARVQITIGAVQHRWTPRLGGVTWLPTRALWQTAASLFHEYPRPVLVDLKAPATGFGYRFDLDTWDESEPSYSWYGWSGSDGDTGALEGVFASGGGMGRQPAVHARL